VNATTNGTGATVRLTIPARAEYITLCRLALTGIARVRDLPDEVLADLKLALTEACGNSVRHAYPDGSGHVSIAYSVDGDAIEMIVEDQGIGVGAAGASSPGDASGMGVPIIRTVVDQLEIGPGADGRGTIVRMTKRLTASAE